MFKFIVRHHFILFSVCLSFVSAFIEAETKEAQLACYQLTEATLKNGLRVCLKQSQLEPGEFNLQVVANGGYASLLTIDQPSAWLAAEVAWESGLDQYSGDELECSLDDHSVEMNVKLGLFDRKIEAAGPLAELAYCLHLTRLLFTNPQFNEEGFKEAIAHARYKLQQKAKAGDAMDSRTFTKINLRNWYTIAPFNLLDLNKIELTKTEHLFKKFFHNPAEFILVLVGDFNSEKILPLLEESLGTLSTYPLTQWNPPEPPAFPDGITKKEFSGVTRYKKSYTRLTFPLSTENSDPIILDLLCSILKQRFQATATPQEAWKTEMKIGHRFPLFPYLKPSWLVIKFNSETADISSISHSILKTLENIKQTGITENEIRTAYSELRAHRPSTTDSAYELTLLANSLRVGGDILHLYILPKQENQEKMMLKKVGDCYPNLDQYSIISLHP